jgi:Domain of unknown function (DUF4200)
MSSLSSLIRERRLLHDFATALEDQKVLYTKETARLAEKEQKLCEKDTDLQKELMEFTKKLESDDLARKKNEKKANEILVSLESYDIKISHEKSLLKKLQKEKDGLVSEYQTVEMYEKFMATTLEKSEFKSAEDLLLRYGTLKDTESDLLKKQTEVYEEYERVKEQAFTLEKDKQTEIMGLLNEQAQLESTLEVTLKKRAQLTESIDRANAQETDQVKDLGNLVRSIDNILEKVKTSRKGLQHASILGKDELEHEETASTIVHSETTDIVNDENAYYEASTQEALKRLRVLESYMRDLTDIAEACRKEKRAASSVSRNNNPASSEKRHSLQGSTYTLPEPEFVRPHESSTNKSSRDSSNTGTRLTGAFLSSGTVNTKTISPRKN